MSSTKSRDADFVPTIVLVYRANRALQSYMARQANRRSQVEFKPTFNAVFATLDEGGSRTIDMADQAGITRQSMGEVVREMVRLGLLEMRPDPDDRRAKLVTYTEAGRSQARAGYQQILELEQRLSEEFGSETYDQARKVLGHLTRMLEGEEDPTS